MYIANPIYDSVMKYLLEDNKLARLFLGTIIGHKIEKLEPRPQEYILDLDEAGQTRRRKKSAPFLTVYRLDFSAQIRLPDGTQQLVVLELQKAKFHTDIMRFRRYLGQQYARKENIYKQKVFDKKTKSNKFVKKALPIISIYFLGHRLEMEAKHAIIGTKRQYVDLSTGEIITEKNNFIESLTHDSIVIQLPELKQQRRTDLENLLSIFDQSYKTTDIHILNIDETNMPEQFKVILRKLQQAMADTKVRMTMTAEDDILDELGEKEREISDLEENVAGKDKIIEEKDKILEENAKVLEENAKVLEAKEKELEAKEKALAAQVEAFKEQLREIEALKKKLSDSGNA
ncbi:MAG: hypothetical protein RIS64_4496 [Bacteroidota bacterium]|jgi:hypothetical protein